MADKTKELKKEEVLDAKIAEVDSLLDRIRQTLERNERRNEEERVKSGGPTPGLVVRGPMLNPTFLEVIERPYVEEKPGNHFRWLNAHPTIMGVRKGQGYEIVKDEEGNPVQAGDAILGTMPREKYLEKIVMPKRRYKRERREEAIKDFKDAAHDDKVGIFGKITYDNESIEIGDSER